MDIRLAPPCNRCRQPYLTGRKGVCNTCHSRDRRKSNLNRLPRPLLCACGKTAVAIILVEVGIDDVYTVRLAVCQDCLQSEQDFDPQDINLALGSIQHSPLPSHILKSRDHTWQRVDWP